ncbi:MAG: L-histidine N(alpha)-methyltransferase [Chloroflexi bacterium]|nr:L-histidine N(alpha)-methyltransferase [Chloroflexota bacterium]
MPESTRDLTDYSFTRFANLDFYRQVNSRLLDLADVGKNQTIVDLGCGTGAVTRLMLDRIVSARQTVIYAIDHSSAAIRQAIAELGDRKTAMVKFVQAEVQNLRSAVQDQVDSIVYCNSIHYVPDKGKLLDDVRSSLRPGGTLAFNTTFFEGSNPPESETFYRRWMMRSLRILVREHGLRPVKADKTEARRQLSAEGYKLLLREHGFGVSKAEVIPVEFPLEGYIDISGFRDFIEGTLPGVPLEAGSDSLKRGAKEAFEDLKIQFVPRNWLNVVAVRA